MTEAELLASFDQSLDTLQHLAGTYDNGYAPIVFLMATEVNKILTENGAATKLRGMRIFQTPTDDHDENVLSSLHKLTIMQLGGDPPSLSFLPVFYSPGLPLKDLDFRSWWHRDVIYRASAAKPGGTPGMIPILDSLMVPYEERERTSRMRLVNLLRNALGAHQTSEMPTLLDDLQETRNWGSAAIQTPDGILSTDDGSLPVLVSPLAAMMRQITHELLVAYGRDDPPPTEDAEQPA